MRVIAATSRNLPQLIDQGQFREDLYYRLNVIPIQLPPLRERLEDIPALVAHFTRLQKGILPQRTFATETLKRLKTYHWPGNVRELKNLVERLLIMTPGEMVTRGDLPTFITPQIPEGSSGGGVWEELMASANLREAREHFERAYLRHHLDRNEGNISRTADVVGMERSALHRKLKSLGLG
ncbi:MAG: sigma 54-interacting transcriptional regulator [Magnetococcus sp. WYHC-3]